MAKDKEPKLPELTIEPAYGAMGGWVVKLDGEEVEGTAVEKADKLAEVIFGAYGEEFTTDKAPWYHDGKPCERCADARIAELYLERRVTFLLVQELMQLGYSFPVAEHITRAFLQSVVKAGSEFEEEVTEIFEQAAQES